jgi:hypothetical protein
MLDQVFEVVGNQPEVERHEHRTQLRHGIERLELRVGIRRDVGDAVARADAHFLQHAGPAVAAVAERVVGPALRAVHHGFAAAMQAPRAPQKFQRSQRHFHSARDCS